MTNVMLKMHLMLWMVDYWMVGNCVSRWLAMEDLHLLIVVVVADAGEGKIQFKRFFLSFFQLHNKSNK